MSKTKDWTGNRKSIYVPLGASNHSNGERQNEDFYATDPKATELLLELEKFNEFILEPCCGQGHISKVLTKNGYKVISTDLVDRGYGIAPVNFLEYDFLTKNNGKLNMDIITNPPYKYAKEFVERSLQLVEDGCKVAMFLKVQFLEGKARRELFEKHPPKRIWVSSSRLLCAKNGDFETMKKTGGSAVAYAWFIWEKGYTGKTELRWFN